MISDNIRGTAAVAALASLAMLASAGVASAAAIGTPTIIDGDTTFVNDETVDLLGGDLGEAANFGLVGFDSIRLNAHTNGNIATAHAYVGAAFGNHAAGVGGRLAGIGRPAGRAGLHLPGASAPRRGRQAGAGRTCGIAARVGGALHGPAAAGREILLCRRRAGRAEKGLNH